MRVRFPLVTPVGAPPRLYFTNLRKMGILSRIYIDKQPTVDYDSISLKSGVKSGSTLEIKFLFRMLLPSMLPRGAVYYPFARFSLREKQLLHFNYKLSYSLPRAHKLFELLEIKYFRKGEVVVISQKNTKGRSNPHYASPNLKQGGKEKPGHR